MSISGAILGLPLGTAGWRLLQSKTPADFTGFAKDPGLKRDIAYLQEKLPTKLTAKAMLADPRLQRMVLSAYGLDAQVGMNGLMEKVLNSNMADTKSVAMRMSNTLFRQIATDFNYGGTATPAVAAVPSSTQIAVDGLDSSKTIGRVSGSFGGVTVHEVDTSEATSRAQLATTLQAAFRRADGNRSDISVTVFGTNLILTDAKGRGAAQNLSFGGTAGATATLLPPGVTSAAAATTLPSSATLAVSGLLPGQTIGNFSGTFGGVTLTATDTSAATTRPQLAATLQAAFRAADGGRSDISVTAYGGTLIFKDAKTRGGAEHFSLDTPPGGATAKLLDTTVGSSGVAAAPVLPTASTATLTINAFQPGQAVNSFSGSFGGVSVKSVKTDGATNWKELASTLQAAFRAADGGRADISVTARGHTLTFTDSQGSGGASGFNFDTAGGATATLGATSAATPPVVASTATLAVSGLGSGQTIGSITGTFAGITPPTIDTSGATTVADLAATLQTAFRAADNNAINISVTVDGNGNLAFSDAKGRGGAGSFSVAAAGGPIVTPTKTVAGHPPVAAVGGPKVTSDSFMAALVKRYTEAQFEQTVGDTSQSLRRALYAKDALPKATNWYTVIADPNLAAVVQTVLDLPASFGKVEVDQQVNILKSRMNIADFKDATKLGKLLDTFVAKASLTETSSVSDPTGMLSLFQPIDLSGGSSSDSFSGASSAALFALL